MQTLTRKELGEIMVKNAMDYEYGNVKVFPLEPVDYMLLGDENRLDCLSKLGISTKEVFNMNFFAVKSGNKILIIKNRHMGLTGEFIVIE